MRATTKKGFWTLTRVVKIRYCQYDDYENCDEPLSLKKAKMAANEACENDGIEFEPIKGEDWQVEDFDEDE